MLPLNGSTNIFKWLTKPGVAGLLLLLIFTGRLPAQDQTSLLLQEDFLEDARHAIHLAYNLEYDASVEYLGDWQTRHPDHPLWEFWPVMNKWWEVVPDLEQEEYDEAFFDQLEKSIEASDKHLDNHPDDVDALIIKAAGYGFSARLNSNRHNWYRAVRDGRRAMSYLEEVEEKYPGLPDSEFGNAMYQYFSAFLRDEYPAVRIVSWALSSGDRQKGLELLDYVADEGIILGPESRYFLGHINLHYEESFHQALPYLESLASDFPKNSYFTRMLIRAHFRYGNNAEAKRLLDDAFAQEFLNSRHIELAANEELHYMYGRILMREQNYEAARDHLEQSQQASARLSTNTERRFQVQAGYYLGRVYQRLDDPEAARRQFTKIANADTDSNLKEQAQNRLNRMN